MFHLLPHILMPSAQRECFLLLTKKDIAFQRCLFCSLGIAHKKRHCFSAMSLLFAWDCSQKKDIAFQRCLFCSFRSAHKKKTLLFQRCLFVRLGLLTKKRHCFSAMSLLFAWGCSQKRDIAFQRCLFWVPDGTRTHDIQNHNLTL